MITILVIDDDPSAIQSIINILQNDNFEYDILSSSKSTIALKIAEVAKPDIIITDWDMPELNGIEFILELKKNEATKEIPVIMATGIMISSSDLKLALECGAYDFIRKPIDEIELLARIQSALKFVTFYNLKIASEKLIAKINEEKSQAEIESKNRELLSKTLLLLHIKQKHEQFSEEINSIDGVKDGIESSLLSFAKGHIKEIITYANKQIWNELEFNFEKINEDFFRKIITLCPTITSNERKICAYLRLNLSTKEISSITSQTIRSIEIARIRLRDKLGLKGTEDDLHSFLLKI